MKNAIEQKLAIDALRDIRNSGLPDYAGAVVIVLSKTKELSYASDLQDQTATVLETAAKGIESGDGSHWTIKINDAPRSNSAQAFRTAQLDQIAGRLTEEIDSLGNEAIGALANICIEVGHCRRDEGIIREAPRDSIRLLCRLAALFISRRLIELAAQEEGTDSYEAGH